MKKNFKKVAATFLCLILALSFVAIPALAMESTVNETSQTFLSDPRFQYIGHITSSLSFEALGRANCTGTFMAYDDYNSRMYVALQQFKDNRWNDYQSWSENYTGSGTKLLNKEYYVPSGYRYRVITTVVILNNNGNELERVACISPVQEY